MEQFVVVGAGLAGAATAWRLAARGHEVTVLEQFTPANQHGSSHGSARILRYAYTQLLYAEMVVRARRGWDDLERNSGTALLTPTGSLDYGPQHQVRQIADVLQTVGVDHEVLSAQDARSRWPGLRFDSDVLWHPDAAVLDSAAAVEAMLGLATRTGQAKVRTGWSVSRLEPITGGYRIVAAHGESIDAANVIITAGGWLPTLLARLALPAGFVRAFPSLQVRQEQAVHFPWQNGNDGERWPTFIYKGHDMAIYGLPGGRDAGFRGQMVAQFNGGRIIGSAQHRDGMVEPAARQRLIDFAERALPGLTSTPCAETTCLFTSTPTEDFVFDRVDGITVVSPCSGHGAKFAPLLGELAADLALGRGGVPAEFRVAAHASAVHQV